MPRPEIQVSRRSVTVTLKNNPVLTPEDRDFIARLGSADVSREEFRALLHAHRHGRVENAELRSLIGLDTLEASTLLRGLRDRNLLELHRHGANSFYTLASILRTDRGELGTDRGELGTLPLEVSAAIEALGKRPRTHQLRAAIELLCSQYDWLTPAQLAYWLHFNPAKLTERHLSPMVEAGRLERRYPENLTHPDQAYRARAQ